MGVSAVGGRRDKGARGGVRGGGAHVRLALPQLRRVVRVQPGDDFDRLLVAAQLAVGLHLLESAHGLQEHAWTRNVTAIDEI